MLMTIAEASRAIAAKKLSPVELTSAYLARIDRLDSTISAFITVTPERALADARAAEARIMKSSPKTPLDGIPIGHKDLLDTAGIPTTASSRLLENNVPNADATIVTKLAQAGTVMLGKLATLEFMWTGPSFDLPWPPTRNPWNTGHFTSGSSSGTAAAVAAGLVMGGTGSDTGGSIRIPAAFCGVSGIKPTYGRCSRVGAFPLAYTLDHIGPMAWTAEDCAMLLQQMAGFDPADPASAHVPVPDFSAEIGKSVKGLRIGVVRHFFEADNPVSSETLKGIEASLDIFRSQGAIVRDVTLSPLKAYTAVGRVIVSSEAVAVHEHWLKTRYSEYGERLRHRLVLATTLTSSDYIQALRRRRELCHEMTAAMADIDLLVTAASVGEAPLIDEVPHWDGLLKPSFMTPWSLTGYPAMSVCTGFGEKQLPLAVQIGGKPFEEATLLGAAYSLETATPWRDRRPALIGSGRAVTEARSA
jgi:aspartyl-tRNA(Asn)/glutamyl-tRNA(Gln) amidotransferase subunit A